MTDTEAWGVVGVNMFECATLTGGSSENYCNESEIERSLRAMVL